MTTTAELDMRLYSTYDPENKENITIYDVQREVGEEFSVMPPLPDVSSRWEEEEGEERESGGGNYRRLSCSSTLMMMRRRRRKKRKRKKKSGGGW